MPDPKPAPMQPGPIEDYALIGDCVTAALVSKTGSIDWLCWPRFDSEACFAALLGDSRHGRWLLAPQGEGFVASRAYVEDTNVLETRFAGPEGEVALVDFMPVHTDTSRIVRLARGVRGRVRMRMELVLRFDYGSTVPWVEHLPAEDGEGIVAIAGPNMVTLRSEVPTRGADHHTVAEFDLEEGREVAFVLADSPSHLPPARAIDPRQARRDTEAYWRDWTSRCEYKGKHRELVVRSLLALKAMTYRETGGMVAAVTTSLPEELGGSRNWDYRFCWLRDATLLLLALMSTGHDEEAASWRHWLQRSVAGNPEQMQIMYGLSGERRMDEWEVPWLPGYQGAKPVRIGNGAASQLQIDVFGEVMNVFHQARQEGLGKPEESWALQCAMMGHLDQVWRKPDESIWEIRGASRHFTFSKVMAWVAFDRAIRDAEQFGLAGPVEAWRASRDEIHALVCDQGYDSGKNAFTQSFGCSEMDASLLLIPIVGFLPADDPRVRGTIEAVERELLVDGFVLRYRNASGVDGLAGGEGAFLACSFWLASAYRLSGRHADASALFDRLAGLCNDVGLLAEEYDPRAKRFTGNFPQAFSHVAMVTTALRLDADG